MLLASYFALSPTWIVYIYLITDVPCITITVAEAVFVGWANGGCAILRQELIKVKILQNL